MLIVESIKLAPLLQTRIPPHGANIDHPVPKLHKRAPLARQLHARNVPQTKVHKRLVAVLAEPLDEAARRQRLAEAERGQAVLGEAEVEHRGDGRRGGAELLLLLDKVGAADEADCALVPELREELQHFGRGVL